MFTDFRLKVIRFFRKNSKIIFIVICVWVIIFFINMALKNYEPSQTLQTTYDPHTSVMDSKDSVPKKTSNEIEDMLEEYMGYCFDGNVESAYNMLSDSCKEYSFNNDIDNYVDYLSNRIAASKKYAIQDFSNEGNTYIYQIKYSDDMLATGLTNTAYSYKEEKIIFKKKSGKIEMAVGSFIDYEDIKNISENEYLKIDVKSVEKYYSTETYVIKFTNRSDYTVVIADSQESNEILLTLKSKDTRTPTVIANIVLEPNESRTVRLTFNKFYDNNDDALNLTFGSIRVMEQYSGTRDVDNNVIQSEIQNAISKFSVSIPITYSK